MQYPDADRCHARYVYDEWCSHHERLEPAILRTGLSHRVSDCRAQAHEEFGIHSKSGKLKISVKKFSQKLVSHI